MVRLEGSSRLKNPMTSGIDRKGLPACSTVPQSTTLQRAPMSDGNVTIESGMLPLHQRGRGSDCLPMGCDVL
jgi:hypothetical protein